MSWLSPVTRDAPPSKPAQSQSQPDLSNARRVHQIVKLKPECYDEYKKCHAEVWPEVLEQIRRSNIVDCKSLDFFKGGEGKWEGSGAESGRG